MSRRGAPSARWYTGMALGAAGAATQLVLPVESTPWTLAALATTGIASAVMAWAAWRMPVGSRAVWAALAAYAALTFTADAVYSFQSLVLGEEPFPGPADPLYLAAYVAAIAALALLVRRLHPGRDASAWIDAGIIAVAAMSVGAVVLLEPVIEDAGQLDVATYLSLAYPLLDLLVLALLVRLLVGSRRLAIPLALVTASFGTTLVADLIYNSAVVYGDSPTITAIDEALFTAAFVLLAGAATAPRAASIDVAVPLAESRLTTVRTTLLTVGVLIPPVLLLVVQWPDGRPDERVLLIASIVVILLTLMRIRGLIRVVEMQASQLGRQARTDSLTGLPNRRTLDFEIDRAVERARAAGHPVTVAMLDIDHFKSFNDRFGHQAGDQLLRAAAAEWSATIPAGAFLARYGGEEFALLLPGVDAAHAASLLERLRAATPPERTVSIGYAELSAGETGFTALNRADRALYEAKAAGRDRVLAAVPD
jgi:diguanylate cyclase (GGDEF)-like protein